MKYAVFGPRELRYEIYTNKAHIAACIGSIPDIELLISGGGQGVETLAEQYANERKIPFKKIPPNYLSTGVTNVSVTQAFDTRNIEMIAVCDKVIVFWDGAFAAIVPILQRSMIMTKSVLLFPLV